jgi:hypothetical protein
MALGNRARWIALLVLCYHLAFLVAAAFAAAGALLGAFLLRPGAPAHAHEGEEAIGAPAAETR